MLAQNLVGSRLGFAIDLSRWGQVLAATLRLWRQRRREREELARMTEMELKDLSLTPNDQRALLQARFWKCYPFAEGRDRANDL